MKAWGSDLFLLSTVIRYMLGKPGDLSFFFSRERIWMEAHGALFLLITIWSSPSWTHAPDIVH